VRVCEEQIQGACNASLFITVIIPQPSWEEIMCLNSLLCVCVFLFFGPFESVYIYVCVWQLKSQRQNGKQTSLFFFLSKKKKQSAMNTRPTEQGPSSIVSLCLRTTNTPWWAFFFHSVFHAWLYMCSACFCAHPATCFRVKARNE
jgi:hypothetical protein